MNGPTQTGFVPKSLPSLATCVGDNTTPSVVARVAVSGVNGVFRWITTVYGPGAVTVSTDEKSLARDEPGSEIMRWIVVTTACALNGVPSLNSTPCRSGIV